MNEWQSIIKLLSESTNKIHIELLDGSTSIVDDLNINESSVLANVLKHISSISINSYLRLLGGDNAKNDILSFNEKIKHIYPGNKLIVANDIWGGLFAVNNGDFAGDVRNIWYFAPDELQWTNLDINYSQFIYWICSENINAFYRDLIWENMEDFIENVDENQAILVYPFLWSKECNIETANKTIVNLMELVEINAEYQKKFFC